MTYQPTYRVVQLSRLVDDLDAMQGLPARIPDPFALPRCAVCMAPMALRIDSPNQKYCGVPCRKRAYRDRLKLQLLTPRPRLFGMAVVSAGKTHCPAGHPYNDKNTMLTKAGWRVCLICKRRRSIEYNRRHKAAAS